MATATKLESVIGLIYADATDALAQHDWNGFYPVVEDGVIVAVAEAADTRYTIIDDAYMVAR